MHSTPNQLKFTVFEIDQYVVLYKLNSDEAKCCSVFFCPIVLLKTLAVFPLNTGERDLQPSEEYTCLASCFLCGSQPAGEELCFLLKVLSCATGYIKKKEHKGILTEAFLIYPAFLKVVFFPWKIIIWITWS